MLLSVWSHRLGVCPCCPCCDREEGREESRGGLGSSRQGLVTTNVLCIQRCWWPSDYLGLQHEDREHPVRNGSPQGLWTRPCKMAPNVHHVLLPAQEAGQLRLTAQRHHYAQPWDQLFI
jgi:hypothetical protein